MLINNPINRKMCSWLNNANRLILYWEKRHFTAKLFNKKYGTYTKC